MYHGSEFDEMSETSLPSVKFEVRNSLTDLSLKILEAKCDLTSTPVEDIVNRYYDIMCEVHAAFGETPEF